MKLNRKVELGLKVVEALRTKSGPTRTQDLAVEVGTTVNLLEQIMRELRLAEIVLVKRGPGGGYSVNPAKEKITAYDVATAVGREFGSVVLDDASTSRLRKSIVDAYNSVTL